MRRPSLGACARLVAPIHARISPTEGTVSNEVSKLIRGRYMAKVIPVRSKSLTNLRSLAAPAHPQPYSRVHTLHAMVHEGIAHGTDGGGTRMDDM